jgi:hypothetical protein
MVSKSDKDYVPLIKDGRVIGETVPVSIGTAIPIETIINNQELQGKYNALYINVRTVLRNLIGAYEKAPTNFETGAVIDTFIEEIDTLLNLAKTYFTNGFSVTLYYPSYGSVVDLFTRANVKEPITKLQREKYQLERKCYERMLKERPTVIKTNCKLSGANSEALIVTHYPIDLLSFTTFRKLTLLESHTGHIKDKPQWLTKLSTKSEHSNLPFNILTLQILGDGKMFGSMGSKYTGVLTKLAESGQWTTLTTKERVKFDINRMNDKLAEMLLKEMLNITLK